MGHMQDIIGRNALHLRIIRIEVFVAPERKQNKGIEDMDGGCGILCFNAEPEGKELCHYVGIPNGQIRDRFAYGNSIKPAP